MATSRRSNRKVKSPTRERGMLWKVRKPERLQTLVGDAMRTTFGNSYSKAAAASGLSESWLRRLLDGARVDEIELRMLYGVLLLLGEGRGEEWADLFMPSGVNKSIGPAFKKWRERFLFNSSHGSGTRWVRVADEFIAEPIVKNADGLTQRDRDRNELWASFANRYARDVERFEKIFENDTYGLREISFRRVLDPLIDSAETGYFTESWRELHLKRWGKVIKLGIQREEALMLPLRLRSARLIVASDNTADEFERRHGAEAVRR